MALINLGSRLAQPLAGNTVVD